MNLINVVGISTNILAKLGKGEFVSMYSMQKICKPFDCDVGDVCVINEKNHQENEQVSLFDTKILYTQNIG